MSGRDVTLRIYTQAKNIDRVGWAMESLKRAMKWDEDTFGARPICAACLPRDPCMTKSDLHALF